MTSRPPSPPDPARLSEAERQELISAYLDGELDPAAARAVGQWLDGDPEALREVEHLRRIWDLLGTYVAEPARPGFAERVLGAVGAPAGRPRLRLVGRLLRSRPALAAAALLLGVGAGLGLAIRDPQGPPGAASAVDRPEPAPGTDVVALLEQVPDDHLRTLLEQADVLLALGDAVLDADLDGDGG